MAFQSPTSQEGADTAEVHETERKTEREDTNLAGVLAALQEAQAHHVAGDLAGVGLAAGAVGEDGGVQALQELGVVVCGGGVRREDYPHEP